ncbi:ABC transporter substrate-binding protein [Spirochaetia bacterium]|nr:ABC transporter substrate-binding protein [Spirochaetia bacterium]
MKMLLGNGRLGFVVFAALIGIFLFAGCAKKGEAASGAQDNSWKSESGFPIVLEPSKQPKLKIFRSINDVEPEDSNENLWMQKAIADTGIQIEWITAPGSSAAERVQMMLASNDLPDAFWTGIGRNHLLQYLDKGVFMPVDDLVAQYMPNLRAVYEKRPEYLAMSYAPDGKLYGFPRVEEMKGLVMTPGPVYVYKPWMDKLGISMPKTLDETVQMLYAFKQAGDLNGNGVKDEYPISWDYAEGWDHIFGWFSAANGIMDVQTGFHTEGNHLLLRDKKLVYAALDEGFQKTAILFHQFYRDGVLNPDSFAPHATGSSLHAQKLQSNLPMIGMFQAWGTEGRFTNTEVQKGYVSMPRVQGPKGKTGYIRNNSELTDTTLAMITADCKYPELIARFVDYCMIPANSATLNWGAEGAVYVKDNNGILRWDVDESGQILKPKFGLEWWQLRGYSTIWGPNVILNDYYETVVEYPRDAQRLYDEQAAGGKVELLQEYEAVSPRVWFQPEEQAELDQILPQINNVYDATLQRWIIDGGAETEFARFKTDLENAGLNRFLSIYQKAFDLYFERLEKLD